MRNLIKQPNDTSINKKWLKLKDSDSGKAKLHRCPTNPAHQVIARISKRQIAGQFVWDRLYCNFNLAESMRYIRYYDTMVLTSLQVRDLKHIGLVWLRDLDQWITDDDFSELNDKVMVGNHYYSKMPYNVMYCEYSDEYCYDDDMVKLEDADEYCNQQYAIDNFYRDDNGNYYRDEDNMPRSSGLRDYGDRADLILGYGDTSDCIELNGKPLFLGVELEIDATGDREEIVNGISGEDAICKEDGTLDDETGFEIVTKPMGLDDTSAFFTRLLRNYKSDLKAPKRGYGLHVHISKNCLNKREQARIAAFVSNPANLDFLIELGRRNDATGGVTGTSSYAKFEESILFNEYFFNRYYSTKGRPLTKTKSYKKVKDMDRYQAINFTNSNTIEFRFFASTTNTQHLLQSVEFCQALAHYVVNTSGLPARQVLTFDAFYKWVSESAKLELYPHYNKFINPENQEQFNLIAA